MTRRIAAFVVWLFVAMTSSRDTLAHGLKSALLTIEEASDGSVTLFLKVPVFEERVPYIDVVLPTTCSALSAPKPEEFDDASGRAWRVRCAGGIGDKPIEVRGLGPLVGDVLVRYRSRTGATSLAAARTDAPIVHLDSRAERADPAPSVASGPLSYVALGARHVLGGIDHLLFVLGLLLVVRRRPASRIRAAIGTVTAFTIAHSITLALATLGSVELAPLPVEFLIASSILLLAIELSRGAGDGATPSLTFRYPWAIAFGFGLLHGFGFAGALREIGFPKDGLVAAILLFNAGVELGQLMFVAAVTAAGLVAMRLAALRAAALPEGLAIYGMGTVASYFAIDRFFAMGWI